MLTASPVATSTTRGEVAAGNHIGRAAAQAVPAHLAVAGSGESVLGALRLGEGADLAEAPRVDEGVDALADGAPSLGAQPGDAVGTAHAVAHHGTALLQLGERGGAAAGGARVVGHDGRRAPRALA